MMVMMVITDDGDDGDGDVGSNLLNKAGGLQVETRTDPLSGANVVIVLALSEGYLLQHRPMDLAPVDRALKLRQSAIVPFHPTLCSEQKFGRDR